MTITAEQLKQLADPYRTLISEEQLIEHRAILNNLTVEDRFELAIKIMSSCPEEDIDNLNAKISALKTDILEDNGFYMALAICHPSPDEFINADRAFLGWVKAELDSNEKTIATSLALNTPDNNRTGLIRNIRNFFAGSSFATTVTAAFTLHRDIKILLLNMHPEMFFTTRDFNPDLCHQFPEFFDLIKGKEEEIGRKLAQITNRTLLSDISRKLQILNVAAYDQESPFRIIAAAMAANQVTPPVAESSPVAGAARKQKSASGSSQAQGGSNDEQDHHEQQSSAESQNAGSSSATLLEERFFTPRRRKRSEGKKISRSQSPVEARDEQPSCCPWF